MTDKKNKPPLISVGMPVYNGERFLAAAIDSVLAQTQTDFELVIADNASTDSTPEICADYAARDARIRIVRNDQNIGAAGNYNLLVDEARGAFFRWHNADDLIDPRAHALCLAALQQHPDAVLSYGLTMLIDEDGKRTDKFNDNLGIMADDPAERFRSFFERYRLTNAIYGLMRTDAVRNTTVFGDGSLPAADIAFMAELILLGGFFEIPEVLFYRRMHPESSSADREDDKRQQQFWRASASPFRLPVLRQTGRYLKQVWRIDAPVRAKFHSTGYLVRRMVWKRKQILQELAGLFTKKKTS